MGGSPEQQLLSVAAYIKREGGELDAKLIAEITKIALTAKRPSVRFRASQYLVDHWDPVPRAPVIQLETGPVSLTWGPSASPTSLDPSSSDSTMSLPLDAPARPASSATDALANL